MLVLAERARYALSSHPCDHPGCVRRRHTGARVSPSRARRPLTKDGPCVQRPPVEQRDDLVGRPLIGLAKRWSIFRAPLCKRVHAGDDAMRLLQEGGLPVDALQQCTDEF